MDSLQDTLARGLPHSEIAGSTFARNSPALFAACHVLHRLVVPRHPPNALIALARTSACPYAGKTTEKPSALSHAHALHKLSLKTICLAGPLTGPRKTRPSFTLSKNRS